MDPMDDTGSKDAETLAPVFCSSGSANNDSRHDALG